MELYKKIIYVWNEPKPKVNVPTRLKFRSVDQETQDILVDAVSQVMADSLDRSDQKEIADNDARIAARHFISEAKKYFDYNLPWWQLAYDHRDELVGFVQPVIFPDSQQEGLEEATIYYMGVLPNQRGNGYAYDLLCQCTRILQEIGVWRIYCDTDVYNAPMIETFKKVGYEQQGEPKIVDL